MSRIRNSAAAGLLALPLLCCLVGCAAGGGGSTGTTEQTGPSVSDAALAVCIPNCTDHNTDVSELYRRLDEYRGAGQTSEQAVDALMTDVAAAVGTAEAGTDRSEACRPCIETIAAEVYAPVDDDATGGGDGPGGSGTDTPGTPDGDDELEPGVPIAAPPVEFTADETTTASAMITAGAGGTVTAGGSMPARLEIPAGALASDREVSLTLCKAVDSDPYAVGAMFGGDGLDLSSAATLVIPLTEPLPEGTTLTILDLPTDDPADFVDTGVLADVSEDGLEIRIPIEPVEASEAALRAGGSGTPKPKGKAAAQNCLGCPTVAISRTAKKKWGLSAGDAAQEVYNANKHLTAPERQAVADALNNGYNGVVGYVDHKIYRAIQDTFYEVETFSNKLNSKKVGKNLVLEQLKPGCELDVEKKFKKLANDGTPAILNQNRAAFDPTTDRFAHALPVDFRRDAKGNPISTKVQTKNAPVLSKAEQKFIIDQRKAKGEDTTEGAVLYSDADQWNKHQRSQRSAEAVESEFKRLGDPDFGKRKNLPPVDKRGQPWGTMRLLVPRDKPKASPKPIVRYPLTICTADDVSFPCTGDCPDDEATPGDGSDSVAGRCWEITLADVVAHVDSVSGLPEDVDPATIPDTIPVNDMIASAASVIYHFDDAVRLERIWLGLPEVPPELESEIFFDTMELVRLTEANTDWVPGMMTFSNTSQDVQVSADGTRWTVRWSFDINVTAEGASATGTFAYNILDGVFRGVPADRFDSAGYSSTVEVRATNPETGEAMQVRMSATGTASGQLSDTCPDPALENVLSQEEMAALAAESME